MCGIAGFVDPRCGLNESTLEAMASSLEHRGPNAQGVRLHREPDYVVGFAHRRLSIIDLSAGANQPFASDDGRYDLVFNGEIYNHAEIRVELEALGHAFRTRGDTEVLLHALMEWGKSAVHKCIGMFAFAFYDRVLHSLWLCRDRAGVKPLYYSWKNGLFLFSSELKAFHKVPGFDKRLDPAALGAFFRHAYIPAPLSIFADARKLPGGHFLTLNLRGGEPVVESYWDLVDAYNRPRLESLSDLEAIDETEALLASAFQYRMVADVPVGVFLSGGYDSALVAALLQKQSAQPLRTFTIGFAEQGFDEAPAARAIARHLGTDHHEHYCTPQDASAIIPLLPEIYDEPFGDSSQIPSILVSRIARRDVTVVLSGEGGDETFCGYPKYLTSARLMRQASRIPAPARGLLGLGAEIWEKAGLFPARYSPAATRLGKIREIFGHAGPIHAMRHSSAYFNGAEIERLLGFGDAPTGAFLEETRLAQGMDPLEKMMALDYKTYLAEDILTKVDRATMSASLEGREPFLDHRLSEWAASLPLRFKLRDGQTKWITRQVLHRHVPRELMERPKMGFGVPIFKWLAKDLKGLIEEYLDPRRIAAQGILRPEAVAQIVSGYLESENRHPKERNERVQRLWLLLMFQMWYARWMES